ncbi:MAG: sigma-70 family RNA polymerase sigma factor [Planctomycetes bacterium]|jgi:RNA polymerase sigma-70 factor (ECF subfamily)|nr:sigma-70 family RNA polymerase sigma factor [Planctomycetota bacterium]
MPFAPFSTQSDEALFLAFQRHRDCQALGVLFRRRAEELVRLAVFVAPSPSDAEDLVQATFLAAITRAETFRDGGRVMSWLCGILTNQARMLRRASRRRQPSDEPVVDGTGPVTAALQSELRAALAEGIAALPEPYHSVLTLHLEGGLGSHEISQRLARPAATVRKQMERAIERLRQSLPLGLATGLVLRLSPEAMAQNAADAARYGDFGADDIDGGELGPAASGGAPSSASVLPLRTWLPVVFAAAALVALGTTLLLRPTQPDTLLAAGSSAAMADRSAAEARSVSHESPANVMPNERSFAPARAGLSVATRGGDGGLRTDVELLALPVDARSLAERLLSGEVHRARSDATGTARFADLPVGWYQLWVPGAASTAQVQVGGDERQVSLPVAAPLPLRGKVVDHRGEAVADAEVLVSATAARAEPGALVARTGADGTFTGEVHLAAGMLFARHAERGLSTGLRLQADRELRLELAAPERAIDVAVVDGQGRALKDCYVALVPRSGNDRFLPSQHARTDGAGRCTFLDPGRGEAVVVASSIDRAPTLVDLAPSSRELVVTLDVGGSITGRALDADGQPLAQREVQATPASLRSNEPSGALVARRVLTADDGSFTFSHLPVGTMQLRIRGPVVAPGLPFSPPLVASADVTVVAGDAVEVSLQAHRDHTLVGRLRASGREGAGGWLLVATPDSGTAIHRLLGARAAIAAADGSFTLSSLTNTDAYQIGAFPPAAIGTRALPYATARALPGQPVLDELAVDAEAVPRGRLRCRSLDAVGRPVGGVKFELRSLAFQIPTTGTSDAFGSCVFDGLLPGDYWLVRQRDGFGSKTFAVTLDGERLEVDLGDQVLEQPAHVAVVVRGAVGGMRVKAKLGVGDKYVEARTDAGGVARLPVVAPGPLQLLVHGPGMVPECREVVAISGDQEVVVEARPAVAVTIGFDYEPAANPFAIHGPLQVQLFTAAGALVFEDLVGAAVTPGRFELATGLLPGDYRVRARSLWSAVATAEFRVGDAPVQVSARLLR